MPAIRVFRADGGGSWGSSGSVGARRAAVSGGSARAALSPPHEPPDEPMKADAHKAAPTSFVFFSIMAITAPFTAFISPAGSAERWPTPADRRPRPDFR